MQLQTKAVQLRVIALVVNKNEMAASFAECSDEFIQNLKEKSTNKNTVNK